MVDYVTDVYDTIPELVAAIEQVDTTVVAHVRSGGWALVAATEGQDVTLAAGAILRLRLESPLSLR